MAIRTAIRSLCAGLLLAATAPAAPAGAAGAKDPAIAGFEETLCLSKGGPVTVDGANFGPGGGLRLVAIAGPTTFVDFPMRSWSDTKIAATLPDDSRLEPGRIYPVGIGLAGANAVLSNRLSAAVCAAAPEAASSEERDSGFGLGFGIGGFGIGGGGGGRKIESGTSFASPFVTAALAQAMAAQPGRSADEAVQKLVASVRDLGPKGRDETFGWGLVQLPNACGAK